MSHIASQIYDIPVGAVRNVSIDLTDELDSGESLTGTPTIDELTTSDLSITNKTVSTATLSILDVDVAIGKAVQCGVSGASAGVDYVISGTVSSDSTPAQVIPFRILVTGVAA